VNSDVETTGSKTGLPAILNLRTVFPGSRSVFIVKPVPLRRIQLIE